MTTKYNIFLKIFFKELKYLNSIDIFIFSVIANFAQISQFQNYLLYFLAAFIVKKSFIEFMHTKNIESLIFIAGGGIQTIFTINYLINNSIYLLVTFMMTFAIPFDLEKFLFNITVLNLLMFFSAVLKYKFRFKSFHSVTKEIIIFISYFSFLNIILISLKLNIVLMILFIFITPNIVNRTLDYDDIS